MKHSTKNFLDEKFKEERMGLEVVDEALMAEQITTVLGSYPS